MTEQKCTSKNTICFILKLLLINIALHACVYCFIKMIKKHKGFQCCCHTQECTCCCHCEDECDCEDECECDDECQCNDECNCAEKAE